MASIINALSSGTGGIVTAGDASGILQLQTANTAAVTIDGSQNVGIGTASPANKLHVSDTTTSTVKERIQASTGYVEVGMGGNSGVFDTTATDGIRLRMSGNDKVSIDGSTLALSGLQGIKFQATQSASSDANTLDDYEEGNWTPVVNASGGSGSGSYTDQVGRYVKIGQLVYATFFITFTKNTLSGGTLQITGLPFTVLSSGVSYPELAPLLDNLSTALTNPLAQVNDGNTFIDLVSGNGSTGNHVGLPTTYLGTGTMRFRGTAMYRSNV